MLVVGSVSAIDEDYINTKAVELSFDLNSKVELDYKSDVAFFDYFTAELNLYPREDFGQRILIFEPYSKPKADFDEEEDALLFRWDNIDKRDIEYGIEGRTIIENRLVKVYNKVDFPIWELNDDILAFTVPTENIDINDDIKDKANELAEGKDDLYFVVTNIANWVNKEIEYNLSTLTEEVSQPSSWVFENKQGVCDEITNLFISMLRSVGIPARFVTGASYTNVLDDWGLHGWAEVYFPDYGWVPFDVTYGEFGWIDASHIVLQESLDSTKGSVYYRWVGRDVGILKEELDIDVQLESKQERGEDLLDLDLELIFDKVGFESFVPIKVSVKNLNNYYVSSLVYVTKAPGLVGSNAKSIVLGPNQEKDLFWLLNVSGDFEKGYRYTSKVEVKELFGASDETELIISENFPVIERDEAEENVIEEDFKEKMKYNLDLECNTERLDYYEGDTALIKCKLKNLGLSKIENLKVCLKDDCEILDLGIGESRGADFELGALRSGSILIVARAEGLIKYDYVPLEVIKVPKVSIVEVSPSEIEYGEEGVLNLDLGVEGIVQDVNIELKDIGIVRIQGTLRKQKIKIPFKAKDIIDKELELVITYKDIKGKPYEFKESFFVEVTGVPWYIKLFKFLRLL